MTVFGQVFLQRMRKNDGEAALRRLTEIGEPAWSPVMEFGDMTEFMQAAFVTGEHLAMRHRVDGTGVLRQFKIPDDPTDIGYRLVRVRMLSIGDLMLQDHGRLTGEIVRVQLCGRDHEFEVDRLALEHGYVWLENGGYRGYAEIKGASCEYPGGVSLPTATPAPTTD